MFVWVLWYHITLVWGLVPALCEERGRKWWELGGFSQPIRYCLKRQVDSVCVMTQACGLRSQPLAPIVTQSQLKNEPTLNGHAGFAIR